MANNKRWDAIVIGSGLGGLACAAALARFKKQVLVLEQAAQAGGLTQSFSHEGWRWDAGIHYLGDFGQDGRIGKMCEWLIGEELKMAPIGSVYDTLHFPDHFEMAISRPEEALKMDLREKFPASLKEIDLYFQTVADARHAMQHAFALHGMSGGLATIYRFLHSYAINKLCSVTTQKMLDKIIANAKLRAVLSAQWGDYGSLPQDSSFGVHALTVSHYFSGAFYPEGGAGVFAPKFCKTIDAADGRVELNAKVVSILIQNGKTNGVVLANGQQYYSDTVISDIGAHNTVAKLLPNPLPPLTGEPRILPGPFTIGMDSPFMAMDIPPINERADNWMQEILSFKPTTCFLSLYLGFEGHIAAHGAGKSNHWVYNTWDINQSVWDDPIEKDVPMFFISFPSLKDPGHDPGPRIKHTGDMLIPTRWELFAKWADGTSGPAELSYQEFKLILEKKLLLALEKHFPALLPLLKYYQLSTPLGLQTKNGIFQGSALGLETTPRRILSTALHTKTPIPGLYLSGQDVGTPGIAGALSGAIMTAGAIEPKLFTYI